MLAVLVLLMMYVGTEVATPLIVVGSTVKTASGMESTVAWPLTVTVWSIVAIAEEPGRRKAGIVVD
jgi:fucose permease